MAKKRTSGRFTTRYKIFLAVSITAIVLLLLCNIYLYVSRERALAKDQAKGSYPFAALEPMEEKENPQVSLYFYKQLSGEEQEAYDAIERVVSAAADTDVSAYYGKGAKGGIGQLPFALPGEAGEKIVQALRSDHPEYFYWKDSRFDRDEEGNALFIG